MCAFSRVVSWHINTPRSHVWLRLCANYARHSSNITAELYERKLTSLSVASSTMDFSWLRQSFILSLRRLSIIGFLIWKLYKRKVNNRICTISIAVYFAVGSRSRRTINCPWFSLEISELRRCPKWTPQIQSHQNDEPFSIPYNVFI